MIRSRAIREEEQVSNAVRIQIIIPDVLGEEQPMLALHGRLSSPCDDPLPTAHHWYLLINQSE
jgi:hypothetical protein